MVGVLVEVAHPQEAEEPQGPSEEGLAHSAVVPQVLRQAGVCHRLPVGVAVVDHPQQLLPEEVGEEDRSSSMTLPMQNMPTQRTDPVVGEGGY